MSRLLVSVRGPAEAIAAAQGGAHIADVEHPSSALGTPYPLNIQSVRQRLDAGGFSDVPISTNIGEQQQVRSSACQAALGVAVAGADYVKCGIAGLDLSAAAYLGRNLVRSVKEWRPDAGVYPAVFPDEEAGFFDPLKDGPKLAEDIDCDGVLIDTFHKDIGRGLLDYFDLEQLAGFVQAIHQTGKQAWLAGSITREELPALWGTDVDVVCVRAAACANDVGQGRFGNVTADRVQELVGTIP